MADTYVTRTIIVDKSYDVLDKESYELLGSFDDFNFNERSKKAAKEKCLELGLPTDSVIVLRKTYEETRRMTVEDFIKHSEIIEEE